MKIIVTGCTGLVGAEVLRQSILDDSVTEVLAMSRSSIYVHHPKIKELIHKDFLNYDDIKNQFKNYDVCLWCLGISQTQVSKKEYEIITFDYTIAAAKVMLESNENISFLFLSGEGADQTEKTRTLFGRIKGKTENALKEISFKKLFFVRPAGIKPIHKNPRTAFSNKLMIPFFPLFELLTPNFVITSVQLAKAMLHIAKHGHENQIIANVELKLLSAV